ncbi:DUF6480 family protein [Mycobacterium sp. 1274756.6]|uniref:DUF6480 family protein n=1 Tax=Mycobacterium sp. 1274756.6 TaxID=1834076 RepID=UPI0008013EB8|nr:DUF6480 family protein [Mycobacterium sp. 1274756.6]OBJ71450.1 hypothetical protein A5643_07830 [Mycobacterium sp. 1274756.6]
MTASPPDPEPERTPGLEAGGGVAPGSTPPESAQTSGASEPEPVPRPRPTVATVVAFVAIAIFAAAFLATAVFLVLRILS